MQHDETATEPVAAEAWLIELRLQFVEAGHDRRLVDEFLTTALARFRAARLRTFIPILVERSVQRDLRGY
ncbi:MAG: hypothetical protein JWL83_450 [Actinomycetia bacterium]|jgi:hypothetical protein|nr:hypothetical protein [Actinomycetes bacterium]